MDCKVGDMVHVRGTVLSVVDWAVSPFSAQIAFNNERDDGVNAVWINPDTIVHVEPKPLRVGDKVRYASCGGNIIAIAREKAWVTLDSGVDVFAPLIELERA